MNEMSLARGLTPGASREASWDTWESEHPRLGVNPDSSQIPYGVAARLVGLGYGVGPAKADAEGRISIVPRGIGIFHSPWDVTVRADEDLEAAWPNFRGANALIVNWHAADSEARFTCHVGDLQLRPFLFYQSVGVSR